MKKNGMTRVGIIMLIVFTLTGCDRNHSFKDLQTYVDQLRETAAPRESDDPDMRKPRAEPESVKVESGSRRSPFAIVETLSADKKNKRGEVMADNPLLTYPLDVLRFVGTVTRKGETVAIISTPDNKIYQVKSGDVIGDRDSTIVSIDSDRINLEEQYSENGGQPMKRVITLQLKESSQ